ncbi:Agro-virD5 domain containing protein, partial [Pyrenophora tritici-repentis]
IHFTVNSTNPGDSLLIQKTFTNTGGITRRTHAVLENMQDPVEISSAEESSSDDEVIVQEVLVTRTAKRVVRKVTKKPTANDRILGVLEKVLANQAELSKRLQAVEKPQQVYDDFININSIDIDQDSPPKQPRKKRKAP